MSPPLRSKTPHYFSRDIAPFSPSEISSARPLTVRWSDFELQFLTGAGLFSRSEFDDGSHLLLSTIEREARLSGAIKFCDLGCGWGSVGTFWAKSHPKHHVYALDVNARATQLAKINFERNKIENAVAWCADGLSATRDESFDVVACNPPIRAGNAVIETLFDGAYRCLRPQGELWAVIRTAQGAKSWAKKLEAQFGNCETVEMKGGFRILRSVR